MSKIFLQIIFILLLVESCFTQLDPVDEWNLSGKVKAVTETSYTGLSSGKEYVKGPKGWSYSWKNDSKIELDSSGRIVKRTYFDNLGKVIRADEFEFSKGKLIRSKTGNKTQHFEYDSLERIKSELLITKITKAGKPEEINTIRIIYLYDPEFRVKQKLEFNLGNELKNTRNFYYDGRSNLSIEESISPGSKDSIVYTYNSKDQLTKVVWFDKNGKMVERTYFEYIGGKVSYQKWEDFEAGLTDGSVESIYENGNEKSVVDIEADGSISGKENHSYTYDKAGNWIRKVTIIDDEEIFIVERKIEYY